jgi:hypothetical protein
VPGFGLSDWGSVPGRNRDFPLCHHAQKLTINFQPVVGLNHYCDTLSDCCFQPQRQLLLVYEVIPICPSLFNSAGAHEWLPLHSTLTFTCCKVLTGISGMLQILQCVWLPLNGVHHSYTCVFNSASSLNCTVVNVRWFLICLHQKFYHTLLLHPTNYYRSYLCSMTKCVHAGTFNVWRRNIWNDYKHDTNPYYYLQ